MAKSPLEQVQKKIDKVTSKLGKVDALVAELQPREIGEYLEYNRNMLQRVKLKEARAMKAALDKELTDLLRERIILEGEARSMKAPTKPKTAKMDRRYKAVESLKQKHPQWSLQRIVSLVAEKEDTTTEAVKKSYYSALKKRRGVRGQKNKTGGNRTGDSDQAGQAQKK
jgi:hypothetical protein